MKFVNSNIKNNNTLFFKRRSREVINSSLKLYDKFSFSFIHLNFYLLNIYNGDWGLGIGDWGLGIGEWGLGPIPNPQSPIPNPHVLFVITLLFLKQKVDLEIQ